MKKIPYHITQFFTTLGCIIKDARTYVLGLTLTALSVVLAAFPAVTYANNMTAQWITDRISLISESPNLAQHPQAYIEALMFENNAFGDISEVYLSYLSIFLPVFVVAIASAMVLTVCLMALVKKNENFWAFAARAFQRGRQGNLFIFSFSFIYHHIHNFHTSIHLFHL